MPAERIVSWLQVQDRSLPLPGLPTSVRLQMGGAWPTQCLFLEREVLSWTVCGCAVLRLA
jgi:hypothetical protein